MFTERFIEKYYSQSFFDPDVFYEISASDFDDEVVRFRSSYDFHYDENMDRIFIDKETGLIYKVVRLPYKELVEF